MNSESNRAQTGWSKLEQNVDQRTIHGQSSVSTWSNSTINFHQNGRSGTGATKSGSPKNQCQF